MEGGAATAQPPWPQSGRRCRPDWTGLSYGPGPSPPSGRAGGPDPVGGPDLVGVSGHAAVPGPGLAAGPGPAAWPGLAGRPALAAGRGPALRTMTSLPVAAM